MKNVMTGCLRNQLKQLSLLTPFLSKSHFLVLSVLLGVSSSNAYAESQGSLGGKSNGSVHIMLTIPDNLNVSSSTVEELQVNASSEGISKWGQTLCVQGTGIDHYSLSVSSSTGDLVLSNGKDADIPYQVIRDDAGNQVIVPADNNDHKLILKTDESCEDPSSIKVDTGNNQKADSDDYGGAAIINIGVE